MSLEESSFTPFDDLADEQKAPLLQREWFANLSDAEQVIAKRAYVEGYVANAAEHDLMTDTIEAVSQERFDFGLKSTVAACLIGLGKSELTIAIDATQQMWETYDLDVRMSDDGANIHYTLRSKGQQG